MPIAPQCLSALSFRLTSAACIVLLPAVVSAQTIATSDSVIPIRLPAAPLPSEARTAAITRFSFISCGDPRDRHDGLETQAAHELVM